MFILLMRWRFIAKVNPLPRAHVVNTHCVGIPGEAERWHFDFARNWKNQWILFPPNTVIGEPSAMKAESGRR